MLKNFKILVISVIFLLCNCVYATNQSEKIVKDNRLEVVINRSIHDVFEFTTDPHKTHEWISSIEAEQANEWPPRAGTIYKNRGKSGPWSNYKVSKYIEDKEFELIKQDESTYHVKYTYSSCPDGQTKLVYHEWVETGEIDGPFTQFTLDNLKKVMEEKNEISFVRK